MTDDELLALYRACGGKGFTDRRDLAVCRLLADAGLRIGELTRLRLADVDIDERVVFVMGKGSKPRVTPFGDKAARALDRYLRARSSHRYADEQWFWIGRFGPMTAAGIREAIQVGAKRAGIGDIHPHMLRHLFADRALAAGMREGDPMRLCGWTSREMLGRYGAARADARALEAYRTLSPGDRVG